MRRTLLVAAALLAAGPAQAGPPVRSVEILSQPYHVDRLYRSMMGPYGTQNVVIEDTAFPELLWIVGYEARMVGGDGKTPLSQEFMCHSNLDLDMQHHGQIFGWSKRTSDRLFTLSQGQFDIEFPEGFGIPVLSDEKLTLVTQVLNHNLEHPDLDVRHKVTIRYVRDRDLKQPMKPLFSTSATGLISLDGKQGFYQVQTPEPEVHGPGCLPGEAASKRVIEDGFGRKFAGHWVVPPGRQVDRTNVTRWMNLPFDTTVHYIAVHLHPFAESLTLRDLTTGEVVFASRARGPEKGIGLDHVDSFSSAEGLPLYKSHEYELESVYNNTSGKDQDSMAVMYLYLLDREFKRPASLFDPRVSLGEGS
jgi:hypothetical protein